MTLHYKSPTGLITISITENQIWSCMLAEIHYYDVYYKSIIFKLALSDIST